MNLLRISQFLLLFTTLAFIGCGGKTSDSGFGGKTSDSGFPLQQPITPTTATINGRIDIPVDTSDGNLNSSLSRVAKAVNRFSNLTVLGRYLDSTGALQEVTGRIAIDAGNTGATYVVEQLPFGVEITVVVTRGKITLKAINSPLSVQQATQTRAVDPESTAEAILFEEIKKSNPAITFQDQSQSQSFLREKGILAVILRQEIANDNVDPSSLDLLERPFVVSQVEQIADAVVNQQVINHLPYAVVDSLGNDLSSAISVVFRLYDPEDDLATVQVFYSLDGISFLAATLGNTGISAGTSLNAERSDGVSHTFVWESAADLAVGTKVDVILAVDVTPAGFTPDSSNTNRVKTIAFEVDNRGIPAILSLSSGEHLLGQTSVINVQGLNLAVVNQVSLEFLGTDSFINPKVFAINEFLTSNDQLLSLTIPAFGPFPVPYRLSLSGLRPQDRVLSVQEIEVKELGPPDFTLLDPALSPSQGFNHLTREIRFEGRNLMGVFSQKAVLQKVSAPSIRHFLSPSSAQVIDGAGLVEWKGIVPTRLATGAYQIRVSNTCDPSTPCGDEVEVAVNNVSSVIYTVLETFPLIDAIVPSFGGIAFNSQDHEVDVLGERLSSVSSVRISTNRNLLISSFSSQFPVSISSTSYTSLTFIFPLGTNPGTYFVGLENAFGKAVSTQNFQAKEGVIPSTSVQTVLLDPALNPLGSTQVSNLVSFVLDIQGTSLSSLHTVRLINRDLSGVVIDTSPNFTSFTQAYVNIPEHLPPGRYRLDLENSAGLTSVNCNGFSCFEITESAPVITDFSNELKPQDLSQYQIIAGEAGILSILGSSLAGVRSAAICDSQISCLYEISSVSGSFDEVIANLSSSVYMKPGTYFLQVTNQTAPSFSPVDKKLEVLERTPAVDFIEPQVLTSAQLLNDVNVITFTGRNLFGLTDIYLLPSTDGSNPCTVPTTQTPYRFLGTEIDGVSRTQATLTLQNLGTLLPGTYAFRLQNLAPSGTDNLSFCDPTVHRFSVTEPPLEFLSFFNSNPSSPESTTIANHTTSVVTFVGKFLFGLDKVQMQRRGSAIQNLPSIFEAEVTTSFLSQATFQIESGLLPGTYDLLMKNSGMSQPQLVGASVEVTEVITPEISTILILGENQSNTEDIFVDLKGTALEGVGLFTHSINLIDTRDTAHLVALPTTQAGGLIELRALPDQSTFIRAKIPRGTPGGEYLVSVLNTSGNTSPVTTNALIDVFEPQAVFETLSVQGPFDEEFGFGENTRKTRLELRGSNLASSEEVFLQREPAFIGDSSETLRLVSEVIHRVFQPQEITLTTTLPLFLRPGFYDLQIRNNSGEFSEKIDPVSSPFFEQVLVREGAPQVELVGCLDFELAELVDPASVNSECSTSFTTRNVNALINLKFTGRNLYTLSKVEIFPEGSLVAEISHAVPSFNQSLQGTGILTHTSRTVEVTLPQLLKKIGFYDIELTNSVATVRFQKKLKSAELFPATIFTLNPVSVVNNVNTTVFVSGDHLTGTTQVALFTSDLPSAGATLITTLPFEPNPSLPINLLSFSVPENQFPSTYRIRIRNSRGFNPGDPILDTNLIQISEPPPLITTLSRFWDTNETTKTVLVHGDGFLGLTDVVFKPSSTGLAGTSNANMSIPHSQIPLQFSVTSRSLLSIVIPPLQLPGFYQLSMENTNPSSYLYEVPFQVRENPPTIFSVSPAFVFYADDEQIVVTGSDFLGVRGTPVSSTFARLTHVESGVQRDLDLTQNPTYDTLHLTVPRNLLIGLYELEIQNQEGVASTVTVTQFFVKEGLVEIQQVVGTTFQYDDNFNDSNKRVDIFGKHLQGVKRIQITTQIQGRTYTYDLIDGLADPYISITNSVINTDFVYPGQYQLLIENTAGTINPSTPIIDIQIPNSVITDFQPRSGPFNSPSEITITGNHLRRWERMEFQRGIGCADPDDSVNILFIATNTNSTVFQEVSHTETKIIFGSQNVNEKFDEACNKFFNICYNLYGDPDLASGGPACEQLLVLNNPSPGNFQLVGNIPEVDSFEDEIAIPIPTTTEFTDFVSGNPAVATTSIFSGLPLDLVIRGANYDSLQSIKIIRDSDSVEWTLACTSGTGSASLNQGNLTTVTVRIPREIFHFPPNAAGNPCLNPSNLLPLTPGLYSFVVSGTSGTSSSLPRRVKFYFSEGFPNNTSILNTSSTTIFNDVDHDLRLKAGQLLGARMVRIRDQAGARLSDFSVPRGFIVSETELEFTVPKGTLRGLKTDVFGPYSIQVLNSRGWTQSGTGQFEINERAPQLDSILPTSGQNLATSPLIFDGNHLLGVGQPLIGGGFNRLRMFHRESVENPAITTISIDLTASVTVQSLTSFVAVIPKRLRPGKYFFSVENDHHLTAFNPRVFDNILFEALDSSPVVTFVTPQISDFDLLPPNLEIRGLHLSGMRTVELSLVGAPVSNELTLSLISSPDLTSANFDSAIFSLPQSPTFLVPGLYEIAVENANGLFPLANFSLEVLEKEPRLDQIIPVEPSSFDNSGLVTFDLEGDNLFGHPLINVSLGSTTSPIVVTGALQSRFAIRGLTLIDSLFPDTWILSFENTQGSTSLSFIVTEPIPQIESIVPERVSFQGESLIQLVGDHFISASTAPGSVTLTDVLQTPLEEIRLIDRRNMEVLVPQGIQVGRYQIQATNKAGRNTTSAFLIVEGSGLSLNSIQPQTGSVLGGEFLVIEGAGFVQGTRLVIGNSLAQDIRVEPTRLEAFAPALSASIPITGASTSVRVELINPDGERVVEEEFYSYFRETINAPRILRVFPGAITGSGPTGKPINTRIAFEFDQPIDAQSLQDLVTGTLNFHGVEVLSDRNVIGGTLTWGPDSRVFVYNTFGIDFIPNKPVEIGFAASIRSSTGVSLVSTDVLQLSSPFFDKPYVEDWAFEVGAGQDNSALSVVAPVGSGSTAPSTWVTDVVFSKEIDPLTIFPEDIILTEDVTSKRIVVEVQLDNSGLIVHIDPTERLNPNRNYSLRWKNTNLRSLTQHSMSSDFTYQLGSEATGPRLLSIVPENAETGVVRNTVVIFEFDQEVAETSMNDSNVFVLDPAGEKLAGVFSSNDEKTFYTLRLLELLNGGDIYDVVVSRRVKSPTGVPITASSTSAFTISTLDDIDLSGPVIVNIFPSNAQSLVSTEAVPIVTFNESIHKADLTTENFKLNKVEVDGFHTIQHGLTLLEDRATILLTPVERLEHEAQYNVTVASGIRDLSSNLSTEGVSITFTVTPHFDSIGPNIDSVIPANGASQVAISTHVQVKFTEPIDPTDVTAANFVVRTVDALSVAGGYTLEENSTRVRFVPSAPLLKETTYVLEISGSIKDLFGNPRLVPSTTTFSTESFFDNVPPVISNLTVNGIPSTLNGDGPTVFDNLGSAVVPVLHVPENGFTIDIYYEDPGLGGETSGVDQSNITVVDEKQVHKQIDPSNQQLLTNLNLLEQGIFPIHQAGHTRLVIPSNWIFAAGRHILTATVKDLSTNGNISLAKVFEFQVSPISGEEINYPFENGTTSTFSLEYDGDHYLYDTSVQLGNLRIRTLFEPDGALDFLQELELLGFIADDTVRPPNVTEGPSPSVIGTNVTTFLKSLVLQEVRRFFDLDPVTGLPNIAELPVGVRFETELPGTQSSISRLLIGGDNGAESGGGVGVIKSTERSFYNTANRNPFLSLISRTEPVDQGQGVFSVQIIRSFANDPEGFQEWKSRFGPISVFAYTNTGGFTGLPIGFFPTDEDIYQLSPQDASTGLDEVRKTRYFEMLNALESYARILAVSIARVAAEAVGLVSKGIPPLGLYGGAQNIPDFFVASESTFPYLRPLGENNLMRKKIGLFEIFTPSPGDLKLSDFSSIYLRNQIRVTQ